MASIIGEFIGGIGLFVLAMRLMTDGLKAAVAEQLRDILAKWTATPLRGIATGAGITAIVQSSSAVTVAVIGFVNAGILTISQAIGIVFGANIGTTTTGWLVSLVGFNIRVEAFALPLIGVGTALWLVKQQSRMGGIGQALLGFGLFFLGLSILKTAFEGVAPSINLQVIADYGVLGIVLLVGIGSLITLLTQSSSAAVALTLTAASGGVLAVPSAAAMVIGANIGTTSTAIFASIGATSNAKRIALAHVLFNLITGAIALVILPLMLWFIGTAERFLETGGNVAITLALFHTAFNILGVLVLLPFQARLSNWLSTRYRTSEEDLSRPRFLDKTVLQTPVLALNAIYMELLRASEITRNSARAAIQPDPDAADLIGRDIVIVESLRSSIDEFTKDMGRTGLSEAVAQYLTLVFRVSQAVAEIPRLAEAVTPLHGKVYKLGIADVTTQFEGLLQTILGLIDACDPQSAEFSPRKTKKALRRVEDEFSALRHNILVAGTQAQVSVVLLDELLDQLILLRRLARRLGGAASRISLLGGVVSTRSDLNPEEQEPPEQRATPVEDVREPDQPAGEVAR